MNDKLALSFSVATFVAAVGMIFFLRQTTDRLAQVEQAVEQIQTAPRGRPPGATPRGAPGDASPAVPANDALASKDALKKLDHLIERMQQLEDDSYDTYNEIATDLLQIKKEIGRIKHTTRRIIKGLGSGATAGAFAPDLPPADKPLDDAARRKLTDQAAQLGVLVEDGKVTVRGFLNLSPNTSMPIEYFIARFPEASHETLVHIVGNKTPEEVNQNPYQALSGLPTALYKGMLAAGFAEGKPGHPDPDANPQDPRPRWILPTGDTVYLYVKWMEGETEHVARATDWVIDPSTGNVLPQDCLKFTGSMRFEDPETGDPAILTEQSGLITSVWPNRSALVEVALASAAANNYQYNFARIPKPKEEGQLMLELIFSRTPMEVKGDGARPAMDEEKPK
ncbi:MAG: hypothetical protein QNJ98_12265 [Planctomycetota bacterium]|nr:hypothetical protein [Planctomycetota bacterium]